MNIHVERDRGTPVALQSRGSAYQNEITLSGLIATFWSGLWLFVAVIALTTISAAIIQKTRAPAYTAYMIVAPAGHDLGAVGRVMTDLDRYSKFATLAQLPTRFDRPPSVFEEYLQSFNSQRVAQRLATEDHLMEHLFTTEWDRELETWRPPTGVIATGKRAIMSFYGYPEWSPPSAERLSEALRSRIGIGPVPRSDLHAVRASDRDPAFAVELLERLHETIDEMLREDVAARTAVFTEHLREELPKIEDPAYREALQSSLTEQYRVQAHLTSGLPFAARLVREPAARTMPTSMSPLLVIGLASCVGAILGIFVVFLRAALTRSGALD